MLSRMTARLLQNSTDILLVIFSNHVGLNSCRVARDVVSNFKTAWIN